MRAAAVVLLIALPTMILPGSTPDATQIVTLVAVFAAALTVFEYASSYPGLVEFRDAPPFNRIRFGSLFVTVAMLSVVTRVYCLEEDTTLFVGRIGALIGQVIDFPYSPVRLVVLMLPEDVSAAHIQLVRTAAGLAYLVSLLTLAIFMIAQRLCNWPLKKGSFNVWINLPTFDPTAGGDVVERLERDARFNVALGFLLPFLIPAVIKSASTLFGSVSLENPQTLIWTVAAWAFLPASLFMRGIAMGRIANMIVEKRRQSSAAEEGALLPA